MRKNYSLLLLVFAFISISKSHAQVAAYIYSQITGAYSPLTVPGSTVVASGFQDDNAYGNKPIGFNFVYNNTTYTSVAVSTNGWMSFGSYFPNDNFTPISNSGGNGDAVSILAGDMQLGPYQTCTVTNGSNVITFTNPNTGLFFNVGDAITGTGIPAAATATAVSANSMSISANATASGTSITAPGVISFVTTGVSPNRVFTMQWKRLGRYSNDGTGQDDYINAQIKLYETTNVVEIVYGYTGTFNANTMPGEVGLVGMTNADFNNREIPLGFNWGSTSTGLVNNATVMFSNTNGVPFGLTMRWTPPPACTGNPGNNTIISASSLACVGSDLNMNLVQTYSVSGLVYTWNSATVVTGPYTPIATSSVSAFTATNITGNTWYTCVITCTNSAGSYTTAPVAITSVGSVTNTTPYFEGFETVQVANTLPNCSWMASNLANICQVYTLQSTYNRYPKTGTRFAAFNFGTNPSGDHFYTNGLKLHAGITYSAAVNYITDGNPGWSEFSLLYGSAQSSLGLTTIASVTGTITNTIFSLLSNTFTVPNTGMYYIAVKAIGSSNPYYLSWDDLSVTAPCNLNTPTLAVNGGTLIQCGGTPVSLSATGALTYTWTGGPANSSHTVSPLTNTSYTVSGSNIVGCIGSAVKQVTVDPLPVVTVTPGTQTICKTEIASIDVSGANSYTWNPSNSHASTFTLSPSFTNIYTVSCTGTNNCVSTATAEVIVSECLSVSEFNLGEEILSLYPNPSSSVFHMTIVAKGSKEIEIMDVAGKLIYRKETNATAMELDLTNYSSGIYYLKVQTADKQLYRKLIKN